MAFTELITSPLRQDIANREAFLALWPELRSTITNAGGVLRFFEGFMISENDISVESNFRMVLGLEWMHKSYFDDFIASQELKSFVTQLVAFVMGPPNIQVYGTSVGPMAVFSAQVTEILRMDIRNETEEAQAADAWCLLLATFATKKITTTELSGKSLGLPKPKFVGIIGWDSLEIRKIAIKDTDVVAARNRFESFEGVQSFVVKLIPHLCQGADISGQ